MYKIYIFWAQHASSSNMDHPAWILNARHGQIMDHDEAFTNIIIIEKFQSHFRSLSSCFFFLLIILGFANLIADFQVSSIHTTLNEPND